MDTPFTVKRTPLLCFGAGRLQDLPGLVSQFGHHLLIITGKTSFLEGPAWSRLERRLQGSGFSLSLQQITKEPSPEVVDTIVNRMEGAAVDAVVAIGGGSVLDGGKAVSAMLVEHQPITDFLEGVGNREPSGNRLPFIAVPTTAGTGSEATSNAVISRVGPTGFKKSLRHDNYVPDIALVDPELALGCPPEVTFSCGMDTFSQLVEAYLSTNANPYTDVLAIEGIKHVGPALAELQDDPDDLSARAAMAYGSYLSGVVLASAGLGLVHGFASAIGGFHDIPHGVVCGTLMAETNRMTLAKLRKERPESPILEKFGLLGGILGGEGSSMAEWQDGFIEHLEMMTEFFAIPSLGDYGITASDLPAIVQDSSNKYNPVPLTTEEMLRILSRRLE